MFQSIHDLCYIFQFFCCCKSLNDVLQRRKNIPQCIFHQLYCFDQHMSHKNIRPHFVCILLFSANQRVCINNAHSTNITNRNVINIPKVVDRNRKYVIVNNIVWHCAVIYTQTNRILIAFRTVVTTSHYGLDISKTIVIMIVSSCEGCDRYMPMKRLRC